jgi:ABC-type sugar transport system permease subunit
MANVRQKRLATIKKQEVLTAWLCILPSLLLLTIFAILPLMLSFFESFFNSSPYIDRVWTGLKNYAVLLSLPDFWKALWVGFEFVLVIVPVQVVLAFLLANFIIILPPKIASIVKVSIYVPCTLSGIVTGAIFMYLYEYDAGIVNSLLLSLGLDKINFLGDPNIAVISVGIASIWGGTGYVTLVMLGALLDVPKDYYDAAKLDGANAWARMRHITLPLIKNISLYLLVSCFVTSFQLFELPFIMTGGGPLNSTMTAVGFLYQHFSYDDTLGLTYAGGVLIAVFISLISLVMFRLVRSNKSYEE